MKFHLRNAAAALALLAGVSVAAAQTGTTEAKLQLTQAQKAQIYQTLSADAAGSGVKSAVPAPGIKVAVGSPLPSSVELRDIPRTTAAQIPAIARYKFAMLGEDVVLVEPDSLQVVEIIRE